jgi:flagellar basal-body rod protein FlgG
MMTALWTAASGMVGQQRNVDIIANNLANANNASFKSDRGEFKDLLYQTMNRATLLDGVGTPVNLQVGHGSTVVASIKNFATGSFDRTDDPLNVAIDGSSFFMVQNSPEEVTYSRDGSFKISITASGNTLSTTDGSPILDTAGQPITFPAEVDISRLIISASGELSYNDNSGTPVPLGQSIGLVKFQNVYALESIGRNMYRSNSASGAAVPDGELGLRSNLQQFFLESSNVQTVREMVNLIVAQRAYEINSKAITSSDEMLGIANNLKR